MKQKLKRGFTIVELVIVIAVIGILSAVLIPTFSGLINEAHLKSDNVLVRNINERLALEESKNGKNETMHEALEDAKLAGYLVANINATSKDNQLVWDQTLDRFALISTTDGSVIAGEVADINKKFALWKIANSYENNGGYSIYLNDNYNGNGKLQNINTGVDVGENTNISEIEYKNNSTNSQNIIIRTNSAETNLSINGYVNSTNRAEGDVVKHYGAAGIVDVIKIANASYHEYGDVAGTLKVQEGHVVCEQNSTVGVIEITATKADFSKVRIEIKDEKTTSNVVAADSEVASELEDASNIIIPPSVKEEVIKTSTIISVTDEESLKQYAATADIISLANDIEIGEALQITKSLTILGNNHVLSNTKKTGSGTRVINLNSITEDIKLTINSLVITNATAANISDTRAISVYGCKKVYLNLNNCAMNCGYYAFNIASENEKVFIDAKYCKAVTGWCAVQFWSPTEANFENCILIGENNKTYNADGWNGFSTIVINGPATDTKLNFINCSIYANQTTGNKQTLISFRSTNTVVKCDNCNFYLDNDNVNNIITTNDGFNKSVSFTTWDAIYTTVIYLDGEVLFEYE